MNINLDKHDIGLILDALESYQIEHGNDIWTEVEVEILAEYLNDTLEENND